MACWLCWLVLLGSLALAVGQTGLSLPPGFSIKKYATVSAARCMAVSGNSGAGQKQIVYVGTATGTTIKALLDKTGDGVVDSSLTLITNIDTPNGVAWKDGTLYFSGFKRVSGVSRGYIWKVPSVDNYVLQSKSVPSAAIQIVSSNLPGDTWHGRRVLRFGPDGQLYFGIGAPCNVCTLGISGIYRFGSLYRMNVASKVVTQVATGIRNTVGFDWHPTTGRLFFTDNGRDDMANATYKNDHPDCELNRVDSSSPVPDFGFPFCQSGGAGDANKRTAGTSVYLPDPDQNPNQANKQCSTTIKAAQPLGPHIAPLGMRFYNPLRGNMFPSQYHNNIFIAQHGSWNRSPKIGYRVMTVTVNPTTMDVTGYNSFLTGFLQSDGTTVTGRPVDIEQLPDGALLVSDDGSNSIWRITYSAAQAATAGNDSGDAVPLVPIGMTGGAAATGKAVAASPGAVTSATAAGQGPLQDKPDAGQAAGSAAAVGKAVAAPVAPATTEAGQAAGATPTTTPQRMRGGESSRPPYRSGDAP